MAYSKKTFTVCEFNGYTVKPLKDEAKEQKEKKLQWSEKASDKPEDNLHRAQDNLYVLMHNYLHPTIFTWIKKAKRNNTIGAQYLIDILSAKNVSDPEKQQHYELLQTVKNIRDETLTNSKTNLDGEFIYRLDVFLMRELFIQPTQKTDIKLTPNAKAHEPGYVSTDRQLDAEVTLKLLTLKKDISDEKSIQIEPPSPSAEPSLPSHERSFSASVATAHDSDQEDLLGLNSSMYGDDEPTIEQSAKLSEQKLQDEKNNTESENEGYTHIEGNQLAKNSLALMFEILKDKYPTQEEDKKTTELKQNLSASQEISGVLFERINECRAIALSNLNSPYSRELAYELTIFLQQQLGIDHKHFKSSRQFDAAVAMEIKKRASSILTPQKPPNL